MLCVLHPGAVHGTLFAGHDQDGGGNNRSIENTKVSQARRLLAGAPNTLGLAPSKDRQVLK